MRCDARLIFLSRTEGGAFEGAFWAALRPLAQILCLTPTLALTRFDISPLNFGPRASPLHSASATAEEALAIR